MKLHKLDRSSLAGQSFSVRKNSYPHFLKVWHHHPELELVYILESTGTSFVGESIHKFEKGDMVLIGPNLPHMWLNDKKYFEANTGLYAEAISVHFRKDFLGESFLKVPEMKELLSLMNQSHHGIHFDSPDQTLINNLLSLLNKKGFQSLMTLLDILMTLSKADYKLLNTTLTHNSFSRMSDQRLDKVYSYIYKHFDKDISLSKLAEIAQMNPSAFSRYFKRTNLKTLTRFVNEIRVGYACKRLLEKRGSITEICYECGYNNVSNFNKQFKKIMAMSPSEYVGQRG